MKRGKKYVEAAKAVDRATLYDIPEAISLVKKVAVAKFDETIEAHIKTGCDGRHADQQIRGAVVLPHGTGKTVRVLVFAKNAKADEAQAAGAQNQCFQARPPPCIRSSTVSLLNKPVFFQDASACSPFFCYLMFT